MSFQRVTDIKNQLEATQLNAEITPRVFVENFPNTILYVGDVRPRRLARNIFVADVGAAGEARRAACATRRRGR